MSLGDLGRLQAKAGCSRNQVLAVFDLHDDVKAYRGKAVIHQHVDCVDCSVTVPEVYLISYSGADLDLLWCDWRWLETCRYIDELERVHSQLAWDMDCNEWYDLKIPSWYLKPYQAREKYLMKRIRTGEKVGTPRRLALQNSWMV